MVQNCSEGQEKYLRELSIIAVGYFFFTTMHGPQFFTGVFGRWRDCARFLTFTEIGDENLKSQDDLKEIFSQISGKNGMFHYQNL
jgi:hypothetical protein